MTHRPVRDLVLRELRESWSTATSLWPCKSICRATWWNKKIMFTAAKFVKAKKKKERSLQEGNKFSQSVWQLLFFLQSAVNNGVSDAKRSKQCVDTYSRVSGSSCLVHDKHSVTSFFKERKLRLQERQTRASGGVLYNCVSACVYVCVVASPIRFAYMTNQNVWHVSMVGSSFAGVWISSRRLTHSFRAVCVAEIWISVQFLHREDPFHLEDTTLDYAPVVLFFFLIVPMFSFPFTVDFVVVLPLVFWFICQNFDKVCACVVRFPSEFADVQQTQGGHKEKWVVVRKMKPQL